jgi:hypothetical protein
MVDCGSDDPPGGVGVVSEFVPTEERALVRLRYGILRRVPITCPGEQDGTEYGCLRGFVEGLELLEPV